MSIILGLGALLEISLIYQLGLQIVRDRIRSSRVKSGSPTQLHIVGLMNDRYTF